MKVTTEAVVEAFRQAHVALEKDLQRLAEAAGPESSVSVTELTHRLETTRAHLLQHFRFEERNGYMDAVRKREPRLEHTVRELAEEHRQLAESLERLLGQTRLDGDAVEAVRPGIRQWLAEVQAHEI